LVHHIVPRIHAEASGTTYVVPRLCEWLNREGVDAQLHVVKQDEQRKYPFPVHLYPHWHLLPNLGISPMLFQNLKKISSSGTLLHNHSLWMMPNVYPGVIAKKRPVKLIVSPHGTLSEWAWNRSRWKKAIIWQLGQKWALKHAVCFHATAESEYRDIRKRGFRQPVAIIPNGIDFSETDSSGEGNTGNLQMLLFLGRLHPVKGVDLLLRTWRELQDSFPNWRLVIAGPEAEEGYRAYLEKLSNELKVQRVQFFGPAYSSQKYRLYRDASIYVLPSETENFGVTVAEALYAGTPAVVTKGAPWEGLEGHKCGWWIERDKETLQNTLATAMVLPKDALSQMGEAGQRWVRDAFSWSRVARQMAELYHWIKGNTEKPDFVIED